MLAAELNKDEKGGRRYLAVCDVPTVNEAGLAWKGWGVVMYDGRGKTKETVYVCVEGMERMRFPFH